MAVFFLGASNCVLNHSWVEHFKKSTDECVVNESLGSSPSRFALYCLDRIQIKSDDVIILDYTVTEAIYQAPFWNVNEASIAKELTSVADYVDRRGAYVILMLNPDYLSLRKDNFFESTHLKIAEKLALPVLNITELFRRTTVLGRPAQQLMMDNSHHAPHTAEIISQAIHYAVQQVRERNLRPILRGENVWVPRVINLAPMIDPERRLMLETRVRTSHMAPLIVGEVLRLDVKPDEYVLGAVVNMAGRGARVRIDGRDVSETRDFIFDYANENNKDLMGLFAPMRTLIPGSDDGVYLRILPLEGEAPIPDIAQPAQLNLDYNEVSMEGVLIAKNALAMDTSTGRSEGLIDLLATTYLKYAEDLYAASHEAPLCEFSG